MAYQSKFAGAEIDEVITYCKTGNNLTYLNELGNYIDTIKSHSQDLANIKPTILNINDFLNKDVMLLTGGQLKEQKAPINTNIPNGQIIKEVDCEPYLARDKSLLKIINNPTKYAPLYSFITTSGDISCGLQPIDKTDYEIVWKFTPHSSYNNKTNGQIKDLGSITSLGQVIGAVWNDYAEYRESNESEPGRVICENGDGSLSRSYKRLQPGAAIISDTYGFAVGKTEKCQIPIAISGRVLAYPYEDWWTFEPGEPVCAGPDGTVSKMTRREIRKYPDRIIGTVSELPTYENWGTHNIKVNGRIWIQIK